MGQDAWVEFDTYLGIIRSMDSIAALVQSMRLGAGLSQRALAGRAGTSQPAVARYERGVSTPSWKTLERLAEACDRRVAVKVEAVPHLREIARVAQ